LHIENLLTFYTQLTRLTQSQYPEIVEVILSISLQPSKELQDVPETALSMNIALAKEKGLVF